jgi:hypothetical protein
MCSTRPKRREHKCSKTDRERYNNDLTAAEAEVAEVLEEGAAVEVAAEAMAELEDEAVVVEEDGDEAVPSSAMRTSDTFTITWKPTTTSQMTRFLSKARSTRGSRPVLAGHHAHLGIVGSLT